MTQRKRDVRDSQGVGIKDRQKYDRPKKYKVVMYNDDYTPMDFVVAVLMQVFHRPQDEAQSIMMSVHKSGKGIAGVYSKEIADMKVMECEQYAKAHQHPFLVELEPE